MFKCLLLYGKVYSSRNSNGGVLFMRKKRCMCVYVYIYVYHIIKV